MGWPKTTTGWMPLKSGWVFKDTGEPPLCDDCDANATEVKRDTVHVGRMGSHAPHDSEFRYYRCSACARRHEDNEARIQQDVADLMADGYSKIDAEVEARLGDVGE